MASDYEGKLMTGDNFNKLLGSKNVLSIRAIYLADDIDVDIL